MGRLPGRSPWPACACRTCRRFLRRSPWLWLAPDGAVVPEQGGLLHSVYSTEMFPWRLFKTSERELLRRLVGPDVEHLVFLYCTCSQQQLYTEVRRLSASGKDLAAGFAVRNYYTGEEETLKNKRLCLQKARYRLQQSMLR